MTLQQFLDKLAETPKRWVVGDDGMGARMGIRLDEKCPIEAVAGMPAHHITRARSLLGLAPRTAQRVMYAADYTLGEGYDPKLRARLLKACGL